MKFLAGSRLYILAFLTALLAGSGWSQTTSQVRIFADPPDAYFLVDGIRYRGSQSFNWVTGSKHTLEADVLTQTGSLDTRYTFTNWEDDRGLLGNSSSPVQTVTANPAISFFKVNYTREFRLQFIFYSAPGVATGLTCGSTSMGGSDFPGQVFVNQTCYQSSFTGYYSLGEVLNLSAVPNAGFVFTGWLVNGNPPSDSFLRTYTVRGPAVIAPQFAPAKRVMFYTDPEELQVSIDRTPFNTVTRLEDVGRTNPGLRELAVGARHFLSAPSPQQDRQGRLWVFDSFDIPLGPGGLYEVVNANIMQTITAKFVRGATVSFLTQPTGLRLSVNGRENWPSYNFVWAVGSANTVTAPAITTDSRGRKYRFLNWSNGGPATQDITTPAETATGGLRLIANYELMPRVIISTNQPAGRLLVNGAACGMPCTLDGASGSTASLDALPIIEFGSDSRAEFAGWSDAADRARTLTFSGDERRITLNYRTSNVLRAVSDPADGVDFTFDPPTVDGFYPADASVRVTATAREGFRFRRWGGDLEGTSNVGFISLATPKLVRALLDKVPVIPTAGIRNAAGETPEMVVAPGSIISIFGSLLAPDYVAATAGPLAQTLAGTVVQWNNRLLPLLFVSPDQINAQVPSDFAEGEQSLGVRTGNQPAIQGKVRVVRNAPGLFGFTLNEKFYLAATGEDGSVISPDRPARRGETITILGTGFGPYQRPLLDGFPAPLAPPNPVADPVEIRLGESSLAPASAIASPGQVGLVAIRLVIPEDLPSGADLPLTAIVNGRSSNSAWLPIQ
jgi:uncharacterized protein (TIGR03437 family)